MVIARKKKLVLRGDGADRSGAGASMRLAARDEPKQWYFWGTPHHFLQPLPAPLHVAVAKTRDSARRA